MSNKKKILIAFAIVLSLLISFIGGQTYSKYISQVEGKGEASIAKWEFKVNGQKENMSTINLAKTCKAETLVDGKIAPGTSGSFDIIIDTVEAEVGTNYEVKFKNENNKPKNLLYTYQEKTYSSITELEESLKGTINANEENKIKSYTIDWNWKYETGNDQNAIKTEDTIDTKNAIDFANYTFDIVVTGTQAIPTR